MPETAEVKILRIVFVHDAGKIINPNMVDGQLMGALAHGVGNGLYEWMGFGGDGQPLTTNLADYLLVTSTEMPPMEIVHRESPTPLNPLGVKGVGEVGRYSAAGGDCVSGRGCAVAVQRAYRADPDQAGRAIRAAWPRPRLMRDRRAMLLVNPRLLPQNR